MSSELIVRLGFFFGTFALIAVLETLIIRETNSNYGFNLPWWDRLLGTYKGQPAMGHEGMTIGASQLRNPEQLTLPRLLILPLVGDPGGVPINRH